MAEQLTCNQQVDGSTPFTSSSTGRCRCFLFSIISFLSRLMPGYSMRSVTVTHWVHTPKKRFDSDACNHGMVFRILYPDKAKFVPKGQFYFKEGFLI